MEWTRESQVSVTHTRRQKDNEERSGGNVVLQAQCVCVWHTDDTNWWSKTTTVVFFIIVNPRNRKHIANGSYYTKFSFVSSDPFLLFSSLLMRLKNWDFSIAQVWIRGSASGTWSRFTRLERKEGENWRTFVRFFALSLSPSLFLSLFCLIACHQTGWWRNEIGSAVPSPESTLMASPRGKLLALVLCRRQCRLPTSESETISFA